MWSKWPWCPHSNVWHRLLLPTGLSTSTSRRATQPAPRTLLWRFCRETFLKSISRHELFAVQHQKGITYRRPLISNPSVRAGLKYGISFTLNKRVGWGGGGDNINHLIFISTWQSLFRTGPESHGWAGRKCKVKSDKQKKGGGDVKWHLEGRRSRAGRDHLSQEAAESVGEKNVLLLDSRWWSSVIVFFFFFLSCPCFALKLTYAKKMMK